MLNVDVSVGIAFLDFAYVNDILITARTIGGLRDSSTIEEIEGELAKVIEDFDRGVNVEALRRIKETGEYSFLVVAHSQCVV